ncbi:uncharacterized protein BT62DRAFT_689630 [Guyanagaster necrorhizus]|uniref:Uncharacterized protein n=1 Tax=Guyanagaster necrorhizus TaxID=856835 RepID=A0A9P8ALL4_9AGAR|nr:uncharacterized protein BT62DRAFT_689630 [Guyanagaster necrorhizus MCA 3950]KAG7439834.1 hypothetical protein BT62DRAFT_689630 [Guyanagaster necrorhizus MCA 3950]
MSFLRRLGDGLNRLRHRTTAANLIGKASAIRPRPDQEFLLYQKTRLPWWVNWTYGLLGLNIVFTASTMDLVWNNWTKLSTEKPAYATDDDDDDDEKDRTHRILRSTWERFSVAALVFLSGCVTTAVVMQMRSSYVLTFDILADHGQRNLFLQTIRTGPAKGLSFPFNKAYLLPGRSKTEFMIRVDGKPTWWYISLDDNCFIAGKKVSPQEARATIASTWGSKRVSQEIANPFLKR